MMIMIQKENLRVKEESRTEESTEKEEDAYEEDRRHAELSRLPAPVSSNRFGFHLECAARALLFFFPLLLLQTKC